MPEDAQGWMVLKADLSPDWGAFMDYWMAERRRADRVGEEAGRAAFRQQQATGHLLAAESDARINAVRAAERAERRAEAHARSVERRRIYNREWMRKSRARGSVPGGAISR